MSTTTTQNPILQRIKITDGVLWYAKYQHQNATDAYSSAEARKATEYMLAQIQDSYVQDYYINTLCKEYKWKAADTKKQVQMIMAAKNKPQLPLQDATINEEDIEINDPEKFPKWAKAYFQQWKDEGFITADTTVNGKKQIGFYQISAKHADDGTTIYTTTQLTNFVAKPIMHVHNGNGVESLLIFSLKNHLHKEPIVEIPATAIPTPDMFQKYTIGEGNFMMFCNANQWRRVASTLMDKFKMVNSIQFLGWQHHGFFAYVNGAYIPGTGYVKADDNGLVEYNDKQYLIPAASQVYQQAVNTGVDAFEMDRTLHFSDGKINFSQWAHQMFKVYPATAALAIAAIPMALFRDIIYSIDNNCPLLYAFGEPSSGKSKYAESINAVFFRKRNAFNVNSGTDHGFFSYMQRFKNVLCWLNEVDEATLKPEWFQALKGAFDGESRERGRIVNGKLKTEIQKIEGLIMLSGQKVITADDNSLVTRCLIEPFSKEDDRTQQKINDYNTLKQWEDEGLTNLTAEILSLRQIYKDEYREVFNEIINDWRRNTPDAKRCNQRILQNWCHAAANYSILSTKFNLPMDEEIYRQQCLQNAVKWSSFISTSDVLAEFWATIQNLVNTRQAVEGWDYIVNSETKVKTENGLKEFTEPTDTLFIRLKNIHPLYEADSKRRGKTPLSRENLLHYFSSRKYYLGPIQSKKFFKFEDNAHLNKEARAERSFVRKETVASCYAFVYKDLNIEVTNTDDQTEMAF